MNQDMNGGKKSTITEIMEVLKDHPSIMKWVKNLTVFAVGFQVVIFLVVVVIMLKISGVMSGKHSEFNIMKREFDEHFANMERKFDEEKARMRKDLQQRIHNTEQRINHNKKIINNFSDYHSKGMEIMRRSREDRTIEFYKNRGNYQAANQILEERDKRMQERERAQELQTQKNRDQIEKEEHLLKGLQDIVLDKKDILVLTEEPSKPFNVEELDEEELDKDEIEDKK